MSIACPGGPCGKEENRTADKDYQTGTYGRLLTVGTIHLGLTHGVMFPAAGFTVESQGMSGQGHNPDRPLVLEEEREWLTNGR